MMQSVRRPALLVPAMAIVWCTGVSCQVLRPGSAEWLKHCQKWIDSKGYPVDYIEQRTGKRQPGFASAWKGNVQPVQIEAGDVVILSLPNPDGRSVLGAALAEGVEPAADGSEAFVKFSAKGLMVRRWVDQECFVGDTFGQVVQSRVPVSRVVRAWRPSLPLE